MNLENYSFVPNYDEIEAIINSGDDLSQATIAIDSQTGDWEIFGSIGKGICVAKVIVLPVSRSLLPVQKTLFDSAIISDYPMKFEAAKTFCETRHPVRQLPVPKSDFEIFALFSISLANPVTCGMERNAGIWLQDTNLQVVFR